jgi:hypothetical protein
MGMRPWASAFADSCQLVHMLAIPRCAGRRGVAHRWILMPPAPRLPAHHTAVVPAAVMAGVCTCCVQLPLVWCIVGGSSEGPGALWGT